MAKTNTTKKTSTKPATKTAKAAKPKAAKVEVVTAQPEQTPAGECPKGGDHEWTDDGDGRYCSKCKETAPTGKQKPTKPKAAKAAKEPSEKKLSAIDAAAQVLAGAKEPMNAKEMIDAMATQGLWSTPGGKTPHATLYSAILREITVKGAESRFTKTERGRFAAK